jgi:hypothetical protein
LVVANSMLDSRIIDMSFVKVFLELALRENVPLVMLRARLGMLEARAEPLSPGLVAAPSLNTLFSPNSVW